jgi:hypothetical protein
MNKLGRPTRWEAVAAKAALELIESANAQSWEEEKNNGRNCRDSNHRPRICWQCRNESAR